MKFKSVCCDENKKKNCRRGANCAFYHSPEEKQQAYKAATNGKPHVTVDSSSGTRVDEDDYGSEEDYGDEEEEEDEQLPPPPPTYKPVVESPPEDLPAKAEEEIK